ncbi:MAG: transposase [Paraprevotella sp.]|nr:transposase [Paraprevotella sp.]
MRNTTPGSRKTEALLCQIEQNHAIETQENLTSEQGLKHRSNRPIEPEAVFGQIKECGKFRRLRLRGLNGAKIEFGLKALAHNLRKLALKWDKSSFLSIFLSSITVKWRCMNRYLCYKPSDCLYRTKVA